MITAADARKLTESTVNQMAVRRVATFMEAADKQVREATPKGFSTNIPIPGDFTDAMIKMAQKQIGEFGFKTKFIPAEPGDTREPLDYGSPAYIQITW